MKIAAIKKLVENYNINQLQTAEQHLLEELPLQIEVLGDDEGEQLTHILAAIDILNNVNNLKIDLKTAIRQFSERVRNSIS